MTRFEIARKRMVQEQIVARGITAPRVIDTMLKIPRHLFVQEAMADQAYSDSALPIGEKQTISQPYMVALMTELLELDRHATRCWRSAPVPATRPPSWPRSADRVYTVERIRPLALQARKVPGLPAAAECQHQGRRRHPSAGRRRPPSMPSW